MATAKAREAKVRKKQTHDELLEERGKLALEQERINMQYQSVVNSLNNQLAKFTEDIDVIKRKLDKTLTQQEMKSKAFDNTIPDLPKNTELLDLIRGTNQGSAYFRAPF